MAKKAPEAPVSAAPADHVVTVREWNPHRHESVSAIHTTIDSWDGRRSSATASSRSSSSVSPVAATPLGHDELRAKVDRLTKHVKARTVTVTETVTDLVEFEEAEAAAASSHSPRSSSRSGEPWDAEAVPARGTTRKAKPARKGKKAISRKKR